MSLTLKPHLIAVTVALGCIFVQGCTSTSETSTSAAAELPEVRFEKAKEAFSNQDYVSARQLLLPLAQTGHADAQYTLGYMAYYGQGLTRDEQKARQWFEQAAAGGNAKAIKVLAMLNESTDSAATPADEGVVVTAVPEQDTGFSQEAVIDTEQPRSQISVAEKSGATELSTNTLPESGPEAWIRAQPPNNFTIQLISGRSQEKLEAFLARYNLLESSQVLSTQRGGQPWFTVLYGSFSDAAQARAALNSVAEAVKKSGPWVRSFDDIQALLNR